MVPALVLASVLTLFSAFASAGPCPMHDPTLWHGLVQEGVPGCPCAEACRYDHEHKHDPASVDHIFGPVEFEITAPWDPTEVHEAYGWVVRENMPNVNGSATYLRSFRWKFHSGSELSRFHSFWLEAEICTAAGECGIYRRGGTVDYGDLFVNDYGFVDLGQGVIGDLQRRRIHYCHQDYSQRWQSNRRAVYYWYGRQLDAVDHPNAFNLSSEDEFKNVCPADESFCTTGDCGIMDPFADNFFCQSAPDVFDCNKNESTIAAHRIQLNIKSRYDPDGDGFADVSTFVDSDGFEAPSCTESGPECIPFILEHCPVGIVRYRDDQHGIGPGGTFDFDLSPFGEWWIGFPN